MCHASGSKGSQPNNIQAYKLVLKSLQMNGCVKHQNMQMLVKLPSLWLTVKWRPLLVFDATKPTTLTVISVADRLRGAQIT